MSLLIVLPPAATTVRAPAVQRAAYVRDTVEPGKRENRSGRTASAADERLRVRSAASGYAPQRFSLLSWRRVPRDATRHGHSPPRRRRTSARALAWLDAGPAGWSHHECALHEAGAARTSHGEARATLGSPCPKNRAPTTRLQAGPKSMRAASAGLGRLVGAFHSPSLREARKSLVLDSPADSTVNLERLPHRVAQYDCRRSSDVDNARRKAVKCEAVRQSIGRQSRVPFTRSSLSP